MSSKPASIAIRAGENIALILEGVRQARLEAGSFESMRASIRSIHALLELLYQMTLTEGATDDHVDWTVINHALDEARERCAPVSSAANQLWEMERVVEAAADQAAS